MNKLNLALTVIISLIAFSCKTSPKETGVKFSSENDSIAAQSFSRSQAAFIDTMVYFVDQAVLAATKQTDINVAYHQFFDELNTSIVESNKLISPLSTEAKYQFLEGFENDVHKSVWNVSNSIESIRFRDSLITNIDGIKNLKLLPAGPFISYLELQGNNDPLLKSLHSTLVMASDLPANYVKWFAQNHQEFDFNTTPHRIWAAVYIMRIEPHISEILEERFGNKQ